MARSELQPAPVAPGVLSREVTATRLPPGRAVRRLAVPLESENRLWPPFVAGGRLAIVKSAVSRRPEIRVGTLRKSTSGRLTSKTMLIASDAHGSRPMFPEE